MLEQLRVTTAVAKVLAAFLQHPGTERYGLDLMSDTGLPSGTLYPILVRLRRADWVTAEWESVSPEEAGRPARRYYRLTPDGLASARTELAALYQHLAKAEGATGKPRTA